MGRIKDFYRNNRIYCILMIVSVICLIAVGTSVIAYFVNQATSDPYGKRLHNIDEKAVDKELKSIEEYFKGREDTSDVVVRRQGKIIYVEFTTSKDKTNEDVQNIAAGTLEGISEETKSSCDLQFIVSREDMVPYFGAKSSSSNAITWANYNMNKDAAEEETTTKKK